MLAFIHRSVCKAQDPMTVAIQHPEVFFSVVQDRALPESQLCHLTILLFVLCLFVASAAAAVLGTLQRWLCFCTV